MSLRDQHQDPRTMTPEERAFAIASLLAASLLRHVRSEVSRAASRDRIELDPPAEFHSGPRFGLCRTRSFVALPVKRGGGPGCRAISIVGMTLAASA